MTRLAALLLILLMPAVAGAQLMAWAGPQPGDTTDPILTQPDAIFVDNSAGNGTFDFTPTVTQGSNLTFDILSGTLPGSLTEGSNFNTSTGQLTGAVGSGYGSGTYQLRATNESFTSVTETPNEFYDIWVRWHKYTSTADVTNAGALQYLSVAGCKYALTENLSTPGSCLAITADSVAVDGGGFTASYNQSSPITIANPSFETVDSGDADLAEDWNFAAAPNAVRFDGTYTDSTANDGSYSLRFTDATQTEHVVSDGTITLEANTWYAISAEVMYGEVVNSSSPANPGVVMYVSLVGTGAESTVTASMNTTNNGMQLIYAEFQTGSGTPTYNVRAGITGHASATNEVYIDLIKVQRWRPHGISVSPKSWAASQTPDVTSYGNAPNSTISNLKISQGTDAGFEGHGFFLFGTNNVALMDCDVTVTGQNASCAYGHDTTTALDESIIVGNTLASSSQHIVSRYGLEGYVVNKLPGILVGNTVTSGPAGGFNLGSNSLETAVASQVAYNTISTQARYANSFAVIGGYSSEIYGNTVANGTGLNTGHGISINGGTALAVGTINNNTISVQQIAGVNQEYGGEPLGGVFGIQIDDGEAADGTSYREICNNDVTVYGTAGGYCMRMTVPNAGQHIHDNTFRAVSVDSTHKAGCLSFYMYISSDPPSDPDNVLIEDNALITNDGIGLEMTRVPGVELLRTSFEVDSAISGSHPYTIDYNGGSGVHVELGFIDTTYADSTSQTYFEDATIYDATPETADRMIVTLEWTTTIQVNASGGSPISGATVVIEDSAETEVFSGTTDANGRCVAVLSQQQMQGDTKTDYNDHTVTVTKVGSTFPTPAPTFTADSVQTITVTAQ